MEMLIRPSTEHDKTTRCSNKNYEYQDITREREEERKREKKRDRGRDRDLSDMEETKLVTTPATVVAYAEQHLEIEGHLLLKQNDTFHPSHSTQEQRQDKIKKRE